MSLIPEEELRRMLQRTPEDPSNMEAFEAAVFARIQARQLRSAVALAMVSAFALCVIAALLMPPTLRGLADAWPAVVAALEWFAAIIPPICGLVTTLAQCALTIGAMVWIEVWWLALCLGLLLLFAIAAQVAISRFSFRSTRLPTL